MHFLCSESGYSLKEAEGRYFVKCLETNGECTRCLGKESSTCGAAQLSVSLPGVDAWLLVLKHKEFELRRFMQGTISHHGLPQENEGKFGTVYGWEDALKKFPNDVPFLGKAEAGRKVDVTKKLLAKGAKMPFERQWTDERWKAATGQDIVAKRAAHNDTLWRFYTQSRQRGAAMTMEQLRHVFAVGILQDAYQKESNPEAKEEIHQRLRKELGE